MAVVNLKEIGFTNPTKKGLTAKEDIFLGTCFFIGMNYVLVIGGFFILNFVGGIEQRFSTDSTFLRNVGAATGLALIFSTNAALFSYLIVKRPFMSIGILAVIPALVLLWCAVMFLLLVAVVVLWAASILVWFAMILFVIVFSFVLLLSPIVFIPWLMIATINVISFCGAVAVIVFRNFITKHIFKPEI